MELAFRHKDIAEVFFDLGQDIKKLGIKGTTVSSTEISTIKLSPSNTVNTETESTHNSGPSTLAATVPLFSSRACGDTSQKPSFLTIPPELRLPIYELLLVSRDDNGDISPVNLDVGVQILANRYIQAAIVRTCKQVYCEAVPILYGANAFSTMTVTPITRIGAANFEMIRDLDISIESGFSLDFLMQLLSTLSTDAKALRKFSITWEAREFCAGSASRGLGDNLEVVRALAKIKQLDKLLISGYYAKPWLAYLRREMGPAGVEVFEEPGDLPPVFIIEMIMKEFGREEGKYKLEEFQKCELHNFREWQKGTEDLLP
ncbi:uncharacterized protein DSM5745_03174 [Aspergillus mulundensis]|uniref:DUF7730 domain-containing protein n=1 Tax=Aspergillus mulundensis TaxID=1810919 RepID=A0A3D8SJT8_9EURO|nr:hypothetical protein DSM5745_03174 [Aspergillus mulundensis]RDW86532.1 hypothetical protein DSM5745_03174 [Aspergillus mulundensis]